MLKKRFSRVRNEPKRRGCSLAGNPLWPLEDLRNLRRPPFVADPEFTPFAIEALGSRPQNSFSFTARREFPIPKLVSGLPWRFVEQTRRPVVPESDFTPLDLSYVNRSAPHPRPAFLSGEAACL
jgi:hypothetical protein